MEKQNEAPGPIVRTIDMTPTWAALMPAIIATIESGTGDGARIAKSELMRLARLVDKMNAGTGADE